MAKSDFLVMDEMSKNNMDIACAVDITNYQRKNKQNGGTVTIGVASPYFNHLINGAGSGDVTHYAILYIVNKEQYDRIKKAPLSGIEEITDERKEHYTKHAWSHEGDDQYTNDELIDAAMQYIGGDIISCWPESWDKKWYKPGDRIQELRRAGALIAAEIDRLKRREKRDQEQDEVINKFD